MKRKHTIDRDQIRRIIQANRGAAARVARITGRTRGFVSRWLRGEKTSANIARAAEQVAREILRGER